MEPALYHTVTDIVGDSLELARMAAETEMDPIVFCGVRFMAETAKILNPSRTVLLPAKKAGCSLAESITAEDVRNLRKKYPGVPVITYINTYAEVKAETDICCTSGNAAKVVEAAGSDRVIFLPDERCEVHEKFTVEDIENARKQFPDVVVLAHPECSAEVVEACDFSGSTSKMIKYVKEVKAPRYLLLTECSMGDNIVAENPEKEMVRLCSVRCPHMNEITLEETLASLKNNQYIIEVPEDIRVRARKSLDRMLEIS
jgi:quinolinate synthase